MTEQPRNDLLATMIAHTLRTNYEFRTTVSTAEDVALVQSLGRQAGREMGRAVSTSRTHLGDGKFNVRVSLKELTDDEEAEVQRRVVEASSIHLDGSNRASATDHIASLEQRINAAAEELARSENELEAFEKSPKPRGRDRLMTTTQTMGRLVLLDGYRQGLITAWELLTGEPWAGQRVLYDETLQLGIDQ